MRITDFTGKTVSGYTEIKALPKFAGLSFFRLDLYVLNIDSIYLDGIKVSTFSYNDTLIQIPLAPPLTLTDTINVKVYYNGHPQEDPGVNHWGGFKWSGTQAYNLGVGFDTDPHAFGRCWFPCIDDFVDRATYDYYITVDSALHHTAVCGGMLQSVTPNGDGTRTCHWKQTEEIPTYLASVAVGNYICVSDTFQAINGKVPVDIWVNPGDSGDVWTSMPKLHDIFDSYERHFGPHFWCRVGYVSVPFNSGAMEHATNIAYPTSCFTGNNNYESLYGHELFHSWLGNLVTCSTDLDMWINEGWATYAESIYQEDIYSLAQAKNYRRDAHCKNIRYNHIEEGAYYALYGIPHNLTYGTTVYEKGGMAAHTLRGHLGDSLFFAGVTQFLDSMKYKSLSSEQMCDILSDITGSDLHGYFDSWIYTPGFPHFSVDSFNVSPNGLQYDVTVYLREKMRGRSSYSSNVRFELAFMDSLWNMQTVNTDFDGPVSVRTFTIPFSPEIVMVDPEERTADATTDNYCVIDTTFTYNFANTYFTGIVDSLTDSAFVRIEHNWVAPDPLKIFIPGLFISTERYWKIDGIFPQNIKLRGKFNYNKTLSTSGFLDNELITNVADSLVIFYRSSSACDWQIVPTNQSGNNFAGYLLTDHTPAGEYALGIWDWDRYLSLPQTNIKTKDISVHPNPAKQNLKIKCTDACQIRIINTSGKVFITKEASGQHDINIDVSELTAGIYIVSITDCKGRNFTTKFVKE